MQVTFRYSDSDFAAYLMTLGYEHQNIEVTTDRNGKLKAFVYFTGQKDDLLQLYEDYSKGHAIIDPLKFAINRRKINSLIKNKCSEYSAQNTK